MHDANHFREALRSVKYPGFSRDIVSFGLVKDIRVEPSGDLEVQMVLTTSEPAIARSIREAAITALQTAGASGHVNVKIDIQAPAQAVGTPGPQKLDGVRAVVAVASGKGGVGKSTVAANLAAAFAKMGLRTGLCDCDIYGPSIALMFGVSERPLMDDHNRILPVVREGIRMISMGMLLDDDSPAVLRGPMVTRTTQQFLRQVAWAPLDILLLDLPPGTGDIQLTVVQTLALDGTVIVTTPQEVALIDARKAVGMFHKTGVPVLGILENMSHFVCPSDGRRYPIFGEGGARREAARLRTDLLGEIPIQISLRESGDAGRPIVLAEPESPASTVFRHAAATIAKKINLPA